MFLRMIRALMPKDERFIERLQDHAKLIVAGADALSAIMSKTGEFEQCFHTIREKEGAADAITKEILEAIHRTFITPFDRTEIHDLIVALDDTIDIIEEIVQRIAIYRMTSFTPEMVAMAGTIRDCTSLICSAIPLLSAVTRNADALRDLAIRVSTLEGQGDRTLRQGLAGLMSNGADPIMLITRKEIYELLESAIDRCEDVMNVVQGIVIEHV